MLYDGNELCFSEDKWDNIYDGRGDGFIEEYIEEIHELLADEIELINDAKARYQASKHIDL